MWETVGNRPTFVGVDYWEQGEVTNVTVTLNKMSHWSDDVPSILDYSISFGRITSLTVHDDPEWANKTAVAVALYAILRRDDTQESRARIVSIIIVVPLSHTSSNSFIRSNTVA